MTKECPICFHLMRFVENYNGLDLFDCDHCGHKEEVEPDDTDDVMESTMSLEEKESYLINNL